MTFGEKLQTLRKQQKMSQEILAEKIGISRTTVSRWESDQSLPDIQQIIMVSEIFAVSVDYLMYDRTLDAETSQLSDFQLLRNLFWGSTAINLCGMVISMIGWLWVYMPFPIVLGLMMNVLTCVFFEVLPPKGTDKVMMIYARRRYYAANIWILMPTPIFSVIVTINTMEHYSKLIPYLIGGLIYFITATFVTVHLMKKYRN